MSSEEITKMFEDKQNEIEEKYAAVASAATAFNDALAAFRGIDIPAKLEKEDDKKRAYGMGHDIDMRTAFILRCLLVRYGNVLFM